MNYTARLRKEWTILPQAIQDRFPKLWLISGAAAADELSGSYHIHRRTRDYACCGLHRIYPHLRNLFLQVPFLVHTLIKSRTRYNQYKHSFKSQQHICDALTIIETVKMQNRIIYDEVEILSNFHIFTIFCLNLLIFYVILLK